MDDVVLCGAAALTDGGTIHLWMRDPSGRRHHIHLQQHHFLMFMSPPGMLAGRLYWNGVLVGVRSRQEAELLELIRTGTIGDAATLLSEYPVPSTLGPAEGSEEPQEESPISAHDIARLVRGCRTELVGYVESDAYVSLSRLVWLYALLPWNALPLFWHAAKALASTIRRTTGV